MLTEHKFEIGHGIVVTFERQLNASGIEARNTDTLTIQHHGQVIVLKNEEAHEFLKICRDTKFIFTDNNK